MAPLHLAPCTHYDTPTPSASANLIPLFGLSAIAASVARQDPVTGAKRKLRKSYKGHIAEFPGKNEIPTEHYLLRLIYAPTANDPPPPLGVAPGGTSAAPPVPELHLDKQLLDSIFAMEKTPYSGIPGFDPAALGIVAPLSPPPAPASAYHSASGGGNASTRNRSDRFRDSAAANSTNAESSAGEDRVGRGRTGGRRGKRKGATAAAATSPDEASDIGLSTDGGSRKRRKANR
ncbi:Rox3 mediator complex subunit-domain-containing protein [Limtongia smithiae]|uniref:Rox3 mediator complex subunit-domain-containing protein n=1 Tax=Limtongia smithiae TaxID=1125753 RepID=UPI0034CD2D1C